MAGSKSFLILDDDQAERRIMAYTLSDAFPDAQVRQVGEPAEAESLCAAHDLDCMVLDYNMPQIDGLALSQKLRARFPYLPIILVTSVGDEMLAARALRCGVSDYIPKARINSDSIRRTVARAMHVAAQTRIIDEQRTELENFAYALAHDFKQPIRQIRTFTQLISSDIAQGEADEIQQHLTYLNDAARRLSNLVDVLSQYTLLNKPPEMGPVELMKVIGDVRSSLGPYLDERNGEVATALLPAVHGNETLMTQILQNLIVNGLKYNRSPIPRVEVSAQVRDGRCLIRVEDNGIGIPDKYLNEIFKPMVRLHAASQYPGTGLGLTLTRKAVTAQGGTVWCTSQPDRGSVFFVELLMAPPRNEAVCA